MGGLKKNNQNHNKQQPTKRIQSKTGNINERSISQLEFKKTQPVTKRKKQHQVKLATLINSSALEPGPGKSAGKTKGPGDA